MVDWPGAVITVWAIAGADSPPASSIALANFTSAFMSSSLFVEPVRRPDSSLYLAKRANDICLTKSGAWQPAGPSCLKLPPWSSPPFKYGLQALMRPALAC